MEQPGDANVNRREQHVSLDHLGSPRLTTDKVVSWPAISVRHYFGYGEEYGPNAEDPEKLRFTGQERSVGAAGAPDDLDYLHARYFSPFVGRFQSPDPINTARVAEPHTWNKYAYAAGNPLGKVDPTGKTDSDVIAGWFDAVLSNTFLGAGRTEDGNADFKTGQQAGDTFSQAQGALEVLTGGIVANGGVAITIGTFGIAIEIGAPAVGLGVSIAAHGTAVAASGTLHMASEESYGSGTDWDAFFGSSQFTETYDTFEAATGNVNKLENVQKLGTKEADAAKQGFTEKWIGQNPDTGEWFSAFYNPKTGKFTGGKDSTHQEI